MEHNKIVNEWERELEWLAQRQSYVQDSISIINAIKESPIDAQERILKMQAKAWMDTPNPKDEQYITDALHHTEYDGHDIVFNHRTLLTLLTNPSLRERFILALAIHIMRYGTDGTATFKRIPKRVL